MTLITTKTQPEVLELKDVTTASVSTGAATVTAEEKTLGCNRPCVHACIPGTHVAYVAMDTHASC